MNIQTMNKCKEIINKHCTLDYVFDRLEVKKNRFCGTDCRFKIGKSEWQEMPLVRDEDGDIKIPSDYDILKHISDDFNFLNMGRKMTAWDFVWEYYTETEIEDLIEELGYEL